MTKEEFQAAIREVLSKPEETETMVREGRRFAAEVEAFDPEMSRRTLAAVEALESMYGYAKERAEGKP